MNTAVQVWAPAEVRGTCSGGSKSRKLPSKHGICFRPPRANQVYGNPKHFFRNSPDLRSVFHCKPPHPSPPAREATTTITTSKRVSRVLLLLPLSLKLYVTHTNTTTRSKLYGLLFPLL